METVNVTIRMDKDLKAQAEALFADLGLNMTTAITMFTKQAVREQGIPFSVTKLPNVETIKAIEDAHKGINLSKRFTSVEDLMEDLNA